MTAVWLASYPKSGNTWFRVLMANLFADAEPIDINSFPEHGWIASRRSAFDDFLLIDSGLLTHDEVDGLRPFLYDEMAANLYWSDKNSIQETGVPIQLVKVHDAYTRTPGGRPLLTGLEKAVVIVRDPRDVAASLASHTGTSIDTAIGLMNDRGTQFCAVPDRISMQLRQRLLDWSGHLASWLEQRDIPIFIVRYENLIDDTVKTLRGALEFLGVQYSDAAIVRAVEMSDFARLQRLEGDSGFVEAPTRVPNNKFFRQGKAGAWRNELTNQQVDRIERAHAGMMERVGYQPSSRQASALRLSE